MKKKIAVLPGDGIGPEVTAQAVKVLNAIAKRFNQLLRARGIMKGESKYYVSLAHTRADIDHTIGAWSDALKELTSGTT